MAVYAGEARRAVAFPLGGLGAGHVALCGDGALRQWQLLGVPNHGGFVPDSFFALRVSSLEPPDDVVRLLRAAPIAPHPKPAANVSDSDVPDRDERWRWPFVEDTTFEAAYPFARIDYRDAALPVAVALEAHTPFVPLDEDASGLPLVRYRFTVRNDSAQFRHGFLAGALQNAVGWDGVTPIRGTRGAGYGGNVNRLVRRPGQSGVLMDHPGLAEDDPAAGEMLLWTDAPAAVLARAQDADAVLRFVETLRLLAPTQLGDWSDAALRAALGTGASPMRAPSGPSPAGHTWDAGVAAAFALAPGESTTIDIVHAWWFPNRYADFDRFGPPNAYGPTRFWVGNHYATRFGGALDVLDAYLGDRDRLDGASREWASSVEGSDLPAPLRDTIMAQPSLVRSPSVFRTADGKTFAFEGALGASTRNWNGDAGGSCPLSCNHVLNYEQALGRLFPAIGRDMRETEFGIQGPDGSIPHRVVLPLYLPQWNGVLIGGPERPALDGMLGAVLKTYRSVLDGADADWLRAQWPHLRAVISHISEKTDKTGIVYGEQPVTYDIALHGPNMFVGALWLAALRAMSEMSVISGEPDTFAALFKTASVAYDELLWNGEFYAQPNTGEAYDFGTGCLSDQLFGQWWAHELGLGHLLPPDRIRTALRSIVKYNLRTHFEPHGYREFADGDETGLVICSWPHGGRPEIPLRYCDEVWTGVEYQVAAHCLYEGLDEEGLAIVRGVRARYDGTRRNPFNEVECGDHYVRAMAGWSLLKAWTGVNHDATAGKRPGRFPYVAGGSWGALTVAADGSVAVSPAAG